MSLKNLIKVADYYNVKYGFGKIAGDFKLKEFKMPPHNEWRDVWGGDILQKQTHLEMDGNVDQFQAGKILLL